MVILRKKAEPQALNEMAQFKGRGITFEVRSKDHGEIGNPRNSAHVHVLDKSKKEIAEIVITPEPPQKPSDIIYYRTEGVSDGLGKAIVDSAGMQNVTVKRFANMTNWQSAILAWLFFHGK